VRSVRRKLCDSAKGGVDAAKHGIQRFREPAQLVARLRNLQPPREISYANLLRAADDAIYRRKGFPAQPVTEQRRQKNEKGQGLPFDQTESVESLVKGFSRDGSVNFKSLAPQPNPREGNAILVRIEIGGLEFRPAGNSTGQRWVFVQEELGAVQPMSFSIGYLEHRPVGPKIGQVAQLRRDPFRSPTLAARYEALHRFEVRARSGVHRRLDAAAKSKIANPEECDERQTENGEI